MRNSSRWICFCAKSLMCVCITQLSNCVFVCFLASGALTNARVFVFFFVHSHYGLSEECRCECECVVRVFVLEFVCMRV